MLLLIDGMHVNACVCVHVNACPFVCGAVCKAASALLHMSLKEYGWTGQMSIGRSQELPCSDQKYRCSCMDGGHLASSHLKLEHEGRARIRGQGSHGSIGGGSTRIGEYVAGKLLTQGGGTHQKPGILPHTEDGDPRDRKPWHRGKTPC